MTGALATQIHDRITNPAARDSILRFRAALQQVEREVPGLINVFVSEVVDSVEVRPCVSLIERLRTGRTDLSSSSFARSLSPRASDRPPPRASHLHIIFPATVVHSRALSKRRTVVRRVRSSSSTAFSASLALFVLALRPSPCLFRPTLHCACPVDTLFPLQPRRLCLSSLAGLAAESALVVPRPRAVRMTSAVAAATTAVPSAALDSRRGARAKAPRQPREPGGSSRGNHRPPSSLALACIAFAALAALALYRHSSTDMSKVRLCLARAAGGSEPPPLRLRQSPTLALSRRWSRRAWDWVRTGSLWRGVRRPQRARR